MSKDNVWGLPHVEPGSSFNEIEYDKELEKKRIEQEKFNAEMDEMADLYKPTYEDFDVETPVQDHKRPLPCRVDDLDLSRPLGFVGSVADWIDGQCRYPRRKLAVASAITAIGNIGGLRHVDALGGVTANMMTFCVAASSTGKEAVMQAFSDLHRAADVHYALLGGIKSEQEIMRNILDQQASYYNIDEIGILLTKIKKAQKGTGGASYLEGIFGAIMSIYSKANSSVIVGGDVRREMETRLVAALSRAKERDDEEAEAKALQDLQDIESGIQNPFLSLVGYTTPGTFDSVMDGETATQGLVGRAIIVNEPDINPRARHGFKKQEMPGTMAMRLFNLTGRTTDQERKVGNIQSKIEVKTTPEAKALLDDILTWVLDYAEDASEETGEASVAMVRRSFEMIAKVSFILAIPSGVRDVDHVRWAFAYIRAETDAKVALVFANDNIKEKPEQAYAARIISKLDPEKGITAATLANRLKVPVPNIDAILHKMEEDGIVRKQVGPRVYKGKKVVQWLPNE
jgi:hypothetical protein